MQVVNKKMCLYANSFVNNSLYSYMTTDSEWYNMIESVNWKYGISKYAIAEDYGLYNREYNGNDAYSFEDYVVVRPVFYLTSDVEITGGLGTIDDPFLIN